MVAMKTKRVRFWIEMLALTSAIACVLALFLATLGSAVGAAETEQPSLQLAQSSSDQPQAYEGIVTDSRCGAKHSTSVGMTAADCTRVCVHAGEHFALVDGDKAYVLEGNTAALKPLAGQRVKVMGTLNGTTISVASVTASGSS
jgi:hypothetical protein